MARRDEGTKDDGEQGEGEKEKVSELERRVRMLVRRGMIDQYRRDKRRAARDAEYLRELEGYSRTWMDPEAQWLEREYEALYTNTLASLPPQCRLAFLAVREDGKSYAEAAQALGISAKMVGKHINRAHRVFRTVLREYGLRRRQRRGAAGRGRVPSDTTRPHGRLGRVACRLARLKRKSQIPSNRSRAPQGTVIFASILKNRTALL